MTAQQHGWGACSPWVLRWSHLVRSAGHVLDIASGAGRHSLYFAAQGHEVTAVDRDETALAALRARDAEDAPKAGTIHTVVADLENQPWPFSQSFDGIVMTNYLWRPLWPALQSALRPGGVLIMETFALGQETIGKPSRPAFLLAPGEALQLQAHCASSRLRMALSPPRTPIPRVALCKGW